MFYPFFLQGVEWLQAYIPDAVWYNYESVRLFWTLFKQFPLNISTSSIVLLCFFVFFSFPSMFYMNTYACKRSWRLQRPKFAPVDGFQVPEVP